MPLRLLCGPPRNELDTREIIEPCELHLGARFPWEFIVTKLYCPLYIVMSLEYNSFNDYYLTIAKIRIISQGNIKKIVIFVRISFYDNVKCD